MYDQNSMAEDGSIDSPNFTENQFKYAEILSQLAKMALFVSLRPAKIRTEAPDGFNKMMQQIAKDGKSYDTMNTDERRTYENNFMYETHSSQRIGGASAILQQLLHEAHNDHSIQEIRKQAIEDMKMNASRATTKYIDSKNQTDLK